MNNTQNLTPLFNFQVVAIHRVTGRPQFATIPAPSQQDADDYVADMQPDWIVVSDNHVEYDTNYQKVLDN